ncbi:MAG TPA: hypothetical protein VGJ13_05710 [Pseudonocardiaceae bacterium]
MNEVETFARAGERAGAALGSGVRIARKGARKGAKVARENAVWASKEVARRMPEHTAKMTENARRAGYAAQTALAERADVLADNWSPAMDALAERWGVAQEVLAEQLLKARQELAARIEPEPPRRRRRWPWLVLLLFGIAGIAGAAILARRPREIESEDFYDADATSREPGSRDSDPDAGWGSAAGNGVVGVERPSASTD